MGDIVIKYDTDHNEWKDIIKYTLTQNEIKYNQLMLDNIFRSLILAIDNFLIFAKYKPKNTLEYRKRLIDKLHKYNLELNITSNKTLWKYLEYFNDLDDYKKGFNISIDIKDINKCMDDLIFVNVITERSE